MRVTIPLMLLFAVVLVMQPVAEAQEPPSPIELKDIRYKSWVYPNISGEGRSDIRELSKGKKLMIVVYFAPWCPDWNNEIPFLKSMFEKYGKDGLGIVAVGEYDSRESMKAHFDAKGIPFVGVWETDSRDSRTLSEHYRYRKLAGDQRNWGTPWHIFLEPEKFPKDGDILAEKAWVANGKVVKEEAEPFIRKMLGLDAD